MFGELVIMDADTVDVEIIEKFLLRFMKSIFKF